MFERNDIVIIKKPNSNKKYMGIVTRSYKGPSNSYVVARVMAPAEDIGATIFANVKHTTKVRA